MNLVYEHTLICFPSVYHASFSTQVYNIEIIKINKKTMKKISFEYIDVAHGAECPENKQIRTSFA